MKKIERIKCFWLTKVKLEFGINVNNEIIAELWVLSLTDKNHAIGWRWELEKTKWQLCLTL